jgi:hypothetical protein
MIRNYVLFTYRLMTLLDCEWLVVSLKMQCTAGLCLALKMPIGNVRFKNVRLSACAVREVRLSAQSIVDVQACSGM